MENIKGYHHHLRITSRQILMHGEDTGSLVLIVSVKNITEDGGSQEAPTTIRNRCYPTHAEPCGTQFSIHQIHVIRRKIY